MLFTGARQVGEQFYSNNARFTGIKATADIYFNSSHWHSKANFPNYLIYRIFPSPFFGTTSALAHISSQGKPAKHP
jgi:hypothetical protein